MRFVYYSMFSRNGVGWNLDGFDLIKREWKLFIIFFLITISYSLFNSVAIKIFPIMAQYFGTKHYSVHFILYTELFHCSQNCTATKNRDIANTRRFWREVVIIRSCSIGKGWSRTEWFHIIISLVGIQGLCGRGLSTFYYRRIAAKSRMLHFVCRLNHRCSSGAVRALDPIFSWIWFFLSWNKKIFTYNIIDTTS